MGQKMRDRDIVPVAWRERAAAVARALSLGLLLTVTACAQPRYLQLAQDSFSKGADIENRPILSAAGPAGVPSTSGGALIEYTDARSNVRKALGEQGSDLERDGLTGSALALLALIDWRLDDLAGSTAGSGEVCAGANYRDCAKLSSQQAVAWMNSKNMSMPRDRFLMAILPGLLDQNLGLRATQQSPKDASADFESAFAVIGRGLTQLSPSIDPIKGTPTQIQQLQAYGLLSQLQVLKAWNKAIDRAFQQGLPDPSQRLTFDQLNACWEKYIYGHAIEVFASLDGLDHAYAYIPKDAVDTAKRELNFGPHTPNAGICPWQ
jgi:hypothetical protein